MSLGRKSLANATPAEAKGGQDMKVKETAVAGGHPGKRQLSAHEHVEKRKKRKNTFYTSSALKEELCMVIKKTKEDAPPDMLLWVLIM